MTEGWHLLVLVARSPPLPYLGYLQRQEIPYLVVGDEQVDLPDAMVALRSRLGVSTVVSTAGARLDGALLRAGLVDEIEVEVEVVPIAIGGTTAPMMLTAPDLAPTDQPVKLRLLDVTQHPDDRVLLRYAGA